MCLEGVSYLFFYNRLVQLCTIRLPHNGTTRTVILCYNLSYIAAVGVEKRLNLLTSYYSRRSSYTALNSIFIYIATCN